MSHFEVFLKWRLFLHSSYCKSKWQVSSFVDCKGVVLFFLQVFFAFLRLGYAAKILRFLALSLFLRKIFLNFDPAIFCCNKQKIFYLKKYKGIYYLARFSILLLTLIEVRFFYDDFSRLKLFFCYCYAHYYYSMIRVIITLTTEFCDNR